MKRTLFQSLVIVAGAVVIIAFFMPWANVATSVTGISKEVTSAVADTPIAGKVVSKLNMITNAVSSIGDIEIKTTVRGYQIPMLVNDETSKVALSLAEILFKSVEGISWKSYLVYLLPVLAIVCILLAGGGFINNIYVLAMTVLSGIVSIGGLYNLYTMDIKSIAVQITIDKGLWYSMYAFLFMFLVGIAWLVLERKKA